MPLEKLEYQAEERAWGIWRIAEDEQALLDQVKDYESISETITHPEKRLEFIAGRVLARNLLESLGKSFEGVTKDVFGKPFFKQNTYQLSLSHSFPYVAALADIRKSVGIDLEQIKTKLLKIGPRVLHPLELQDAGNDETKHCIYWCAKEALVKIYGKKDLVFSEHLFIDPFKPEKYGILTGKFIANKTETVIPLQYFVFDNFVVVFNT
jgi:4'-phosphopantetheinyl transferase